ncbi:hypothetical protein FISHEDRAFT_70194 [Fistulina hepatica ATCC 64428]|uniref:Protein kinase domain-containing protein n=1 Tax=Fistulina hepatica ATCC 64428 TaxID=1128425 RepID=A0A0D7AME9_9AGAR|nr:hypothetical protein FISHEDRAFT_70194 [Fistulina hepatica ATCC 64428]
MDTGYTLYARRRYKTSPGAYILTPPEFVWSKLAVNEDGVYGSWERLPEFHSISPQIWPARTKDVIVKVISDGIDPTGLRELEILQTLTSEPLKSHPDNQCVPVLEYIRHDKWVFAVFPRWSNCTEPNFESVGEVLDFCEQVTRTLAFFHKNGIAHLDVAPENILMNFSGISPSSGTRQIRSLFPVRYAFIDFGCARMFRPDEHAPANERLVTDMFIGRPSKAPELELQQPYDPFAADVFQTGTFFISYFYDVSAYIPEFFPLLLSMTAVGGSPKDRITMSEAHRRFCEIRDGLSLPQRYAPLDIQFMGYLKPRSVSDAVGIREYFLKEKIFFAKHQLQDKNQQVADASFWEDKWPKLELHDHADERTTSK